MKYLLLYILSIMLISIGLLFIIINLNLLVIGYSFWKFVYFIIMRCECNIFFIGIILLIYVYERGKFYDYK